MAKSGLPDTRQQDVAPNSTEAPAPSLWLYGLLGAIALGLVAISFRQVPDWPGLGVNLATELLGALVILLVVDRRLRDTEVAAVLGLPASTGQFMLVHVSPRRFVLHRFCRSFLIQLRPLLEGKLRVAQYSELESHLAHDFALVGTGSSGKTVLVQMLAAELGKRHMKDPKGCPAPLLFPAARWSPSLGLEESIRRYASAYVRVSQACLRSWLRNGWVEVLIDGLGEAGGVSPDPLSEQLSRMRKAYPNVVWVVSYRGTPPGLAGFDTISVDRLTPDEEQQLAALQGLFAPSARWSM